MWLGGPFDTSDDDYDKYLSNFIDYCDIQAGPYETAIGYYDLDNDCAYTGTRWTIVYKLGFAVALIFTANACIMTLGAWSYPARMLGTCIFTLT